MDWTPGGLSGDVEDRRSEGGGGIGFGGLLVLLVISLIHGTQLHRRVPDGQLRRCATAAEAGHATLGG